MHNAKKKKNLRHEPKCYCRMLLELSIFFWEIKFNELTYLTVFFTKKKKKLV